MYDDAATPVFRVPLPKYPKEPALKMVQVAPNFFWFVIGSSLACVAFCWELLPRKSKVQTTKVEDFSYMYGKSGGHEKFMHVRPYQ